MYIELYLCFFQLATITKQPPPSSVLLLLLIKLKGPFSSSSRERAFPFPRTQPNIMHAGYPILQNEYASPGRIQM